MAFAPTFITLPSEILRNIFLCLLPDHQLSNDLATGRIDPSFRGLIFSCRRLFDEASDYYYGNAVFQCIAGDLVWETIHMNPDKRAVQAFSNHIRRIQRLEIHIQIFQPINEDPQNNRKNQSICARIDLQIADLTSLRSCLEYHKPNPNRQFMKSLVLTSKMSDYGENEVFEHGSHHGPGYISEREMYTAVFDPLVPRIRTFKFLYSSGPPLTVDFGFPSVVPPPLVVSNH